MKILRILNPDSVRPSHVVMVCLVGATVVGSCLLTSGPTSALESTKDWHEESALRAIVHVLNLNYAQTTAVGNEIKTLVFGIGAALSMMAFGISRAMPPVTQDDVSSDDEIIVESGETSASIPLARRQLPPLAVAQVLMVLYVLWSFASTQWSSAPDLALGGSVLLAIGVLWALALGRGLNRPTANVGGYVLMGACVVTGVMAIAYFDQRNSIRRASYPLGNPLFLAACMIPGLMLAVGVFAGACDAMRRRFHLRNVLVAVLCVLSAVVIVWTIRITGARGGVLAAAVGLVVVIFAMAHRRTRLLLAVGAIVGSALALWLYVLPQLSAASDTGRDASLRSRAYAWAYAEDLINRAPFIGHGQGGFTRLGDASATQDVHADPLALNARIAHAHNEWLEVWSDLGAVGLMLVLTALGSTVWAALIAIPHLPNKAWRWTLAALLASLVALFIEECADVGLRIAGLPTVFYTVLGLVWALSRKPDDVTAHRTMHPGLKRVGSGLCIVVGAALLVVSLGDFRSARAYFDVAAAVQNRAFDDATRLANEACRWTLNPDRRLIAISQRCQTYLYIAREYQTSFLDRTQRAKQDDILDRNLIQLAKIDRQKSEAYIALARDAWMDLVRRSPDYWDAGWLEMRLWQLRGVFAVADEDQELASRAQNAASDALLRELKRRPFDPIIALSYAQLVGDRVPVADRFEIIAVPLRHASIPPEYSEYLATISNVPGFDNQVLPMDLSRLGGDRKTADQYPFLPEELRLAANIHFMRDHYALALKTAEAALRWYDWLVPTGAMGKAACLHEIGDYQFFSEPAKWKDALKQASRALDILPSSTPGRQLKFDILNSMITYDLAGNDEAAAANLLRELSPGITAGMIDVELGDRYAVLCTNLIRRDRRDYPADFEKWVQRATELHPSNELAWRLKAQVAFEHGHLKDATDYLRRAIAHRANPRVVYAFVRLALNDHPQNADFLALEHDLRGYLQPGANPTPASKDVPTPPSE